uniref:ApaG domain-containing protein n=1 Tax=Romanomermis culicivorax TaxID=13658 RepID=A0A915L7N9_ROMCU
YKLLEIGRFEAPKLLNNQYETGQFFLHKIFGFRGIILFPWTARVYDRSVTSKREVPLSDQPDLDITSVTSKTVSGNEIKGVVQPYYQVLIDERDLPHIVSSDELYAYFYETRSINHDVLYVASRGLVAIPGLECISHEDIIPYISTEETPIQHDYIFKFFTQKKSKDDSFRPSKLLKQWQEKYTPWLELTDVHRERTESIRVTVIPFYMGCKESINSAEYWWRYSVRLENFGDESVILRERHWKIFSNAGNLEQINEKGVVGLEPELSRRQPAFQYNSHVMQRHPSGHMWGTYKMEKENGNSFECRIPSFFLDSKRDECADPMSTLIDL